MLRTFSLLLLSLMLLTTACQKDDPKPAPTLEGRWELQSAYIRYYNAADGTLIQDGKVSLPAVAEELIITNKELQFPTTFFGNTPGFYFSKLPYTRQTDTLTVTSPALSSYRHPRLSLQNSLLTP